MAIIDLGVPTYDTNSQRQAVTAFPDVAVVVTPSNADSFSVPVNVFVGVGGTITVVPWGRQATTVQFTIPSGGVVPCRVSAVKATGTAASGLVAVY